MPDFPLEAVQIHQVNWTGNDKSSWAAAELQLLGDATSVREMSTLPGVTQQIWLQVHPDASAEPGRFQASVSLSAEELTAQIPIGVTVFKTRFPKQPSMHFGGWDYTDGSTLYCVAVTEENRAAVVEHLQERHVDTPWAQGEVMMLGILSSRTEAL